jgi:hypothetical protein
MRKAHALYSEEFPYKPAKLAKFCALSPQSVCTIQEAVLVQYYLFSDKKFVYTFQK